MFTCYVVAGFAKAELYRETRGTTTPAKSLLGEASRTVVGKELKASRSTSLPATRAEQNLRS